MIQINLDAKVRTESGKGVARKLRREGRIPAVLYGPKIEPISLSVNTHDFNKILIKAEGEQVIFTLNLDGDERLALIKELQRHPVNDRIRHIDFYAISVEDKVEVEVPIKIVGKAKGVELNGGVLEMIQRTIAIKCLPLAIPKEIEVDISDLDVGDALHVSDLTPPEGVEFAEAPDTTLVTVVGGTVQAEEEAEEEEIEEAAEATEEESSEE
ncbi:MAG: 50S ribosomal protein L25/general stress protein Ctc [Thermodesulfobacteria bacterium]|nr:50S ribosomal protein L25/general stress protein Ctc [Thermodesulfobacteriota bacterium]